MISSEYAAGFFDGEGHVGIYPNGPRHTMCVKASLVNTVPDLLYLFREQFGGSVTKTNPENRNKGTWKPAYQWQIQAIKAGAFLSFISPFVRIKRAQVDLALEFLEFAKLNNGRRLGNKPLPDSVAVVQRDFSTRMRAMNKRGVA